jgi:hypothetical protein
MVFYNSHTVRWPGLISESRSGLSIVAGLDERSLALLHVS